MDQDLIRVLERIANTLEENNEVLNRILSHYDGVVPVMTRNAKRVEQAHVDVNNESALDKMYGSIFGAPREQEN
tara:strand:+ start:288 stop:509 length:222 start_codon:yes stop_codon:yes gene_type:complete